MPGLGVADQESKERAGKCRVEGREKVDEVKEIVEDGIALVVLDVVRVGGEEAVDDIAFLHIAEIKLDFVFLLPQMHQ